MQVLVRDNNVDQALKVLKKKMQREGVFREMKLRSHYEKPSERRVREKAEAIRRARKLARKKLQREGLVLKSCIPGCESIDKDSHSEFRAVATIKIGPVKARWKGKVRFSERDPPNSYRISGEGEGGVAGFAKGGAMVSLADKDGGTLLSYNVEAQIGGKLAQLGQRLINSAAKKTADDFIQNFAAAARPKMA